MIEHIDSETHTFTYEILAELAVIYAMKMEKTYRTMFFNKMRTKFLKELEFLKDETLYKILWASFKAEALTISAKNEDWIAVKQVLVKKSKDISPKIMADILVMATKEEQDAIKSRDGYKGADLFSQIEANIILKMKAMSLNDLINLMWSALEI